MNAPEFTPSSSVAILSNPSINDPMETPRISSEEPTALQVEEARKDLEKLEAQVSIHHPSRFPDGGLNAWLVVLGGFCCLFCSFGWINCIGIFQGYYTTHQLKDYTPSQVSWISSLETFCMFFFGPIVGKYYDAYGSRYIIPLGTCLHVFGLMMTSISTKYWQFLLCQGVISATGASLIFYPALGDVSTWFFKKRAFALGIMASGSSLGGVVMPIMIEKLIPRVGFGWTMRITAFMILGLMCFATLTLRSRFAPKGWVPFRLNDFTRHFSEPGYALTVVGSFFFFFGMFLPFNFIVVSGITNGMSTALASYLVSMLNAGSVLGRILPGWISDKVGRYNILVFISYCSGILIFALWLTASSNPPTIVFAILYGFTTGAFVSLSPACVAQISEIREIGMRNGTLFAAVSVAALTGVPIGGALVTKFDGSFLGLQIFAGTMLLCGATALAIARGVIGGWSLKKIV